jgi:hypothetical protein
MTSRIDAWASGDSKRSDSEAARAEIAAAHHADNRRRAARVVAACATDTEEFRILTEMLGLEGSDIAAARDLRPAKSRRRTAA